MADGERRMVFDTRGRRKNVIRVVYAILALLMGASLFIVVGPFNIAELVGNQSSSSAAEAFDDQVERVERRLAKTPEDEQLLLTLTRAQIGAGNAKLEQPNSPSEVPTVTPAARDDYEAALLTWNRYLKEAAGEPNPSVAQLVAITFFNLAETGSASLAEIESNLEAAAAAQRIVAEQQPNLGSLSSLALYEYFNGDFAAGDRAKKRAEDVAPTKGEADGVNKQLAEYRKRAKQFVKSSEQFAKQQQQGGGGEQVENPFSLGPPGGAAQPGE